VDRQAVDKITADQHGLITTAQFVGAAGSVDALKWAVRDEWLHRHPRWRGLYVVAGAPATPYQPHMAATLLGGPAAACSGFAGGWLWNAPDIAECGPELTFFQGRARRIPGVPVHECGLPADRSIVRRHGIQTAAAPLIVVQLARFGARFLAEKVANNLMARTATNPREILAVVDAIGARQPGMRDLRAFCERALKVRGHDDSPAARELGIALLEAGVPPFVTQHHVCIDGHDYWLDFAWVEDLVALEYAGQHEHGSTVDALHRDAMRRSRLTAAGWRVLDVTKVATHAEVIRWVFATLSIPRFRGP
jgi:hypothetical protein